MPRRILEGKVVSDKQDKTVTVRVERRIKDSLYQKVVRKSAKFAAHDENNECKVGETIFIEECKPISKRKTWRVVTGKEAAEIAAPKTEKKAPAKKAEPKKAEKKAEEKTEAKKPAAKKAPAKKAAEKKTEAKKPAAKKKAPAKKTEAKKDKDA